MGAVLRIPLTLLGRGKGAVGGEIILLNCCKWLQINRTFFQVMRAGEVCHMLPQATIRAVVSGHHQGNLWEVSPHPVRVSSDEL